jgi:uncharacterized protein (TIGR02646 family)
MRRIPDQLLDPGDQNILDTLQQKVDAELDFSAKVSTAKRLWNTKGNMAGKLAFKRIKTTLTSMCVQRGICNYCEQSEATDIEHIAPISFYPEQAFVWTNYLLACKICNTTYKLDKWFVLDNQDAPRMLVKKQKPPYSRYAFIQPRIENPEDFLLLNTQSFTFEILPDLTLVDQAKAEKTLDILQLNDRDVLIEARRSTARYFLLLMERLVNVVQAEQIEDIAALYSPVYDPLPPGPCTLDELKVICKNNVRDFIRSYHHPSVWSAIRKVDSQTTPEWIQIFQVVPEALDWD